MPRSSIGSFSRSFAHRSTYAAARSKTISQLEASSEFTERCDVGGVSQVRHTVLRVSFACENFREFCVSVAIREGVLRENLFSSNSRKFSSVKETTI